MMMRHKWIAAMAVIASASAVSIAVAAHVPEVNPATVPEGFLASHDRIASVPVSALAKSVKPKGTDISIQHARLGANVATPWHTHPGAALVTVVGGSLTYQHPERGRCRQATYTVGNGFVDPGHGHVHRAIAGAAGADFYVVYLLPPGSPSHLITAVSVPRKCA
jgi:hypothetical protein